MNLAFRFQNLAQGRKRQYASYWEQDYERPVVKFSVPRRQSYRAGVPNI